MRLIKHVLYSYVNSVLIFFGFVYLFCMSCVSTDCTAGEYLVKEENKCQPCERGTYQSKPLQEKCDDCPLNKTTLGQGHRDEADCVSEYILVSSETQTSETQFQIKICLVIYFTKDGCSHLLKNK